MCVCLAPCASDGPCLVGVGVVCRALVTVRYFNAKLKGPVECAGGVHSYSDSRAPFWATGWSNKYCYYPSSSQSTTGSAWCGASHSYYSRYCSCSCKAGTSGGSGMRSSAPGECARWVHGSMCGVLLQGCCWEGLCVG